MQPARFEHLPREIQQCIARQLTMPEIGHMNEATRNFWPHRVQMDDDLRREVNDGISYEQPIPGVSVVRRDEGYRRYSRFFYGTNTVRDGAAQHYQNAERRLLQAQTPDNTRGRAVPVSQLPQYMLDSFRRNAHL